MIRYPFILIGLLLVAIADGGEGIVTRGLLGITGSCARCHDHKFDPIPQQDYYSLAGIFNNSATQHLPLASDDIVKRFNDHEQALKDLDSKIKSFRKKPKNANQEDATEQEVLTEKEQTQLDKWQADLAELKKNSPPMLDTAHALHDTGSEDMKVALRGNLLKTGDVAPRRFLRVISGAEPVRFSKGSGREELAAAIIAPQNPLTARVFVNRIWQHHFGDGLVRTPSNFGTLGERPTHPDLLDWLASEFVAEGWSLKSLHRQILHATSLHLMGLDHERLTYRYSGRDYRLTDVHGKVVHDIIN